MTEYAQQPASRRFDPSTRSSADLPAPPDSSYVEVARWADYRSIFGRNPEPWREPLGALRLTLAGDADKVDVVRAQHEIEWLTRVLNGAD